MASAQPKLVLSPSRDIPFNKLILSQANVRKIKAGVSIEDLAEDIFRRGLIQGLSARPVHDADGATPTAFEPGFLDPLGRVLALTIRKVF